jgi:hypothetical protein
MLKLPHASYRWTQFSLTAGLVSPVSTQLITMKDEDFSATVDLQLVASGGAYQRQRWSAPAAANCRASSTRRSQSG